MNQPALLIDMNKCLGCNACTVECKREYGAPTGSFRTRIVEREHGAFPTVTVDFRKAACNHCGSAPCVAACPFGASYKNELGAVIVDDARCIGCGICIDKCPYGARFMNSQNRKADKCSLCTERIQAGQDTICATQCFVGAVSSGERDEMVALGRARVAAVKAKHPGANLYGESEFGGLNVLYVLLQEPAAYGLPVAAGAASAQLPAAARVLPAQLPATGENGAGALSGALGAVGLGAAAVGLAVKAIVDRANRLREEDASG